MKFLKEVFFFLVVVLAMWLTAPELSWAPPAAPGPPGAGPGGPPGSGPPPRDPVPEPATAILIGVGALGVYGYKKFRDRNHPGDSE